MRRVTVSCHISGRSPSQCMLRRELPRVGYGRDICVYASVQLGPTTVDGQQLGDVAPPRCWVSMYVRLNKRGKLNLISTTHTIGIIADTNRFPAALNTDGCQVTHATVRVVTVLEEVLLKYPDRRCNNYTALPANQRRRRPALLVTANMRARLRAHVAKLRLSPRRSHDDSPRSLCQILSIGGARWRWPS